MIFFKRLIQNLLKGPATEPYPPCGADTPENLRGRISFDASLCTGCRMCEHVCAGGAIRIEENSKGMTFTLWHNTCAFCGLCVHYCKTGAIRHTNDWHLAHGQSEKYRILEQGAIDYVACDRCGCNLMPVPEILFNKAYQETNTRISQMRQLCPSCRQKACVSE